MLNERTINLLEFDKVKESVGALSASERARKQITESSFVEGLNGLQLTERASRIITSEFDEKLKTTIFHKELNKNVSYQFLIRLELYKLIKHIIGEKEYKGFEMWW